MWDSPGPRGSTILKICAGQCDLLHPAHWPDNGQLNRQVVLRRGEVPMAHERGEMHGFSQTIQAAITIDKRQQRQAMIGASNRKLAQRDGALLEKNFYRILAACGLNSVELRFDLCQGLCRELKPPLHIRVSAIEHFAITLLEEHRGKDRGASIKGHGLAPQARVVLPQIHPEVGELQHGIRHGYKTLPRLCRSACL